MVQGATERTAAHFFCNITLALRGSPDLTMRENIKRGPQMGAVAI